MKILFAIKAMDDAMGGAERVLAELCSGLVARGHDVVLVSHDAPGGESFFPLDHRVRRVALGIGNPLRSTTLKEALQRVAALRRAVVGQRPDVAVGFMNSMYVLMAFALIGTGIPMVASEHIVRSHYRRRRLELSLNLMSWLLVRRVTMPSDFACAGYSGRFRRKLTTLPNPVGRADTPADPRASDRSRKTIVNVGRLVPQKNQKALVDAFAKIAADWPEWHLRIIGEGPLRAELARRIVDFGLDDRIELAGTTRDIEAAYASAQIFVMSSLYEVFGVATAEALAHGLPAIGFADCPGTNELIEDGVNGILVEGDDRTGRLAEALTRLIEDADLRAELGCNGPKSVERFAPAAIVDQWETLLGGVASGASLESGG